MDSYSIINFIHDNLRLNGTPMRLTKPMQGFVHEYCEHRNSTEGVPVTLCKARQTGMTTLAFAFSLGMAITGKGSIGNFHPNMNMFTSTIKNLDDLILDAQRGMIRMRNGKLKSIVEEQIGGSPASNSKFYKAFKNGSAVMNDYAGKHADRLRGKSFNTVFMHEAQCFDEDVANQVNRTSLGNTVYIINPDPSRSMKSVWDMSDQRVWYYICRHCGRLYTIDSSNFKEVWPKGHELQCPHCCGTEDKLDADGKWVPTADGTCPGYHFNQTMIECFTSEVFQKKCDPSHHLNNPDIVANEVWGEWTGCENGSMKARIDSLYASLSYLEERKRTILRQIKEAKSLL